MRIALCMIVKNEEKVIDRCLNSIHDLVDEIWIADTGSTDRTLEIVRKYTDNILHYEEKEGDPFNYGRARNFAQSKTTADIIFSLDADEWLHPNSREAFRENVKKHTDECTTVLVPIWTHYSKDLSRANHVHSLCRLFKNEPRNVWEGRIHEVVPFKDKRYLIESIVILHDKSEKALTVQDHKDKIAMYEKNLKLSIKDHPENPRAYFYLLQTYSESGQYEKAIEIGHQYMEKAVWHEERSQACIYIAKAYVGLKKINEAEAWFIRSTIEDPVRSEPWCYLGDLSCRGDREGGVDWSRAGGFFDIATAYQDKIPANCLFLEKHMYEWLPWYRLSIVYSKLGNHIKGKEATEIAMKYIPEDKDMINNLDWHTKNKTSSPQPIMPISGRPVNVVIPSCTKAHVEKLLASIQRAKTLVPFQVTIVWDKLRENTELPWVEDRHFDDDFIFARNVNRGLKFTCDNVVLNDDTEVNDWWLDEMQAAAYHGTLGIVSPLITDVGNQRQHTSSQRDGVFYTVEPDFLCFVCAYLPFEVLKKVGKFDEGYIWYGYEDNDYCERVKNNDFELKITHRTFIEHKRHSTYGPEAMKKVEQAAKYFTQKWHDKPRRKLEEKTIMTEEIISKEDLANQPGTPNIANSVMIQTFGQPNNVQCGENVEIRHCAYIEVLNGVIKIGKDSVVGAHCTLQGNGNITIGEGTIIGPSCNIYSSQHPTDHPLPFTEAPLELAPVTIGKNVWIGAGVTILMGSVIGDDCIIGAHSLVKGVIPDGSIAFGTPAKVHRLRNIPRERQSGNVIEPLHLERYQFAAGQCQHHTLVLDACCGTGYGSEILRKERELELVAVDISASACEQARHRLGNHVKVIQSDILNINGLLCDTIVCFEALEHMIDDEGVLQHLWTLLKPGGRLVCSVPSNKVSSDVNPFHVRHYSKDEFVELLMTVGPASYSISPQFRDSNQKEDKDADFWIAVLEKRNEHGVVYLMPNQTGATGHDAR